IAAARGPRAMVKACVPTNRTMPRIRSAIAKPLNAPSTCRGLTSRVARQLGAETMRALAAAGLSFLVLAGAAPQPPLVALTIVGPPETVFSGKRDACDGNDVPDAPLRAFRDAEGQVVAFGLHYVNRALRGASL